MPPAGVVYFKEVDSYPGNNLVTTIDLELQKAAEEAFKDKAGAVVAMDPRNGEVLAMINSPAFNPDMFSGPLDSEEWNLVINNPLNPFRTGQYRVSTRQAPHTRR